VDLYPVVGGNFTLITQPKRCNFRTPLVCFVRRMASWTHWTPPGGRRWSDSETSSVQASCWHWRISTDAIQGQVLQGWNLKTLVQCFLTKALRNLRVPPVASKGSAGSPLAS